jgi:hypothetical protein
VLETVRKAIAEGDADFPREGERVLAQAVMEAEVSELTGVPKGERDPVRRLTNRNGCPRPALGHQSRDPRAVDPAGAPRVVFPEPARAEAARRARAPGGRRGGYVLDRRPSSTTRR